MWATPGDRFAILLRKPWLEPTWMAPWSRRSHSCSLGACQHRCNEVVIEMASHAICQRKACWVVRFETPTQNVLGSFCFHLKWSECFTSLYDFKVLNCNGFASRSATNEERGGERERSCKYILKRHASMFSCIFIVLERSHSLCFFPQGQEAVSLGKMPLAELCLHCWRPVQLTPLWKAGLFFEKSGGLILSVIHGPQVIAETCELEKCVAKNGIFWEYFFPLCFTLTCFHLWFVWRRSLIDIFGCFSCQVGSLVPWS